VPLLARIYPNGAADVNHFHAAGGMGFLMRELLDAGLLHADVHTVLGHGLRAHTQEPWLHEGQLAWRDAPANSGDPKVLRGAASPSAPTAGCAAARQPRPQRWSRSRQSSPSTAWCVRPPMVVETRRSCWQAVQAGELQRDFIAVVRYQGPRANGMPELHKLTPPLAALQDRASRWRWSPTAACPAPPARCQRRST
jgi:phosphogluconate dehydratase